MLSPAFAHLAPFFVLYASAIGAAVAFGWFATTLEVSERMRQLADDGHVALKRANCTVDFASRSVPMNPPRLSDQLRGAMPFTALARLMASTDLAATDFEMEFIAIRARRLGYALVRADLGSLISRLEELLDGRKPMAKAELSVQSKEQAS